LIYQENWTRKKYSSHEAPNFAAVKFILLTLFIVFSLPTKGQFTTDVNATGKHKYLMGQPKRTKAQIKARKEQMENYARYMEIQAQYKKSYDSTKVIYLDSIYVFRKYALTYKTDSLWSALPDSMVYNFQPTPDSLFVSQKVLAGGNLPPEAMRYLSNPPRKPSVSQLKASIEDYKNYTKIKSQYEREYDSTKVLYLDSIYISQNMNRVYRDDERWSSLPENLRYPYAKEDSVIVGNKTLNNGHFPPEAARYLANPPPDPKTMILDKMDSTAYSPEAMEGFAAMYAPELPGSQPPDTMSAFGGNTLNPNMLQGAQILLQLAKSDPEEVAEQQAKDQVMKKKYSTLPDQRKPEEGTKRNSLENASLASRIYFGGNLSITSTDPFIMDFGLQLGFWIKAKWLAGIGGTFREQFNGTTTLVTGDSWGHSIFTRYDLPKGFFAYAEYERKINESLFNKPKVEVSAPQWQEAFLAGAGKEFKAGPVRMQFMLLYDFTWRTNDMYTRPFVTKMGFQISKKPRIGK
jgi:hypothetical protein